MSDDAEKVVGILQRVIIQVRGLAERSSFTIRLAEVTWRFLDEKGANAIEVVAALWNVCADRAWFLLDAEGVSAETLRGKFPSTIVSISLSRYQKE